MAAQHGNQRHEIFAGMHVGDEKIHSGEPLALALGHGRGEAVEGIDPPPLNLPAGHGTEVHDASAGDGPHATVFARAGQRERSHVLERHHAPLQLIGILHRSCFENDRGPAGVLGIFEDPIFDAIQIERAVAVLQKHGVRGVVALTMVGEAIFFYGLRRLLQPLHGLLVFFVIVESYTH